MKREKFSLQNIYTPKSIDYLFIIKIIIILIFQLFLIISMWYYWYSLFFSVQYYDL